MELSWTPGGHLEASWGLLGTKRFPEHPVLKWTEPAFADCKDFGSQFGAQNWSIFCYFWGHVLDHFLDNFWSNFWGDFRGLSGVRMESNTGPFFGKAPGGHLGALWEASWLSWGSLGRPGVPELLQKAIQNSTFQNRFSSLS